MKYEKLYQEIYSKRNDLLQGKVAPQEDKIKVYEERAKELDDEDFKKIEAPPVDVKDIQNTPLGVYGFWFRCMLNSSIISEHIKEKDRPILMHLLDIKTGLHEEGFGYDLIFTFEKNDYFSNEVLKKSFVMVRENVLEKCEGTVISWKDGKDIT